MTETEFRDVRRHAAERLTAVVGQALQLTDDRDELMRLLFALLTEMTCMTSCAVLALLPPDERTGRRATAVTLEALRRATDAPGYQASMERTVAAARALGEKRR